MSAACPRVHLEYSLQLVKHRAHERLQHHDDEYGGPFWMEVSPKMKIDDLRKVIAEKCGIMPGMQKLSFAGKNFEDSQRTMEQCVPLPPLLCGAVRVTHVQAFASLLPPPTGMASSIGTPSFRTGR